jgi:hypothetical protein
MIGGMAFMELSEVLSSRCPLWMINKWTLDRTPSIVSAFGDQIYFFVFILHG